MVRIINKPDDKPEGKVKKFWRKLNGTHWALLIGVLIFVFIVWYSSHEVPNIQYINSTDPLAKPVPGTNIMDSDGNIPEGYAQVIRYEPDDIVPKAPISIPLLVAFLIYIIAIIVVEAIKTEDTDFTSAEVCRHIIQKHWNYWKNYEKTTAELFLYGDDLHGNFPQQQLRNVEVDGVKKPHLWIIPGIVKQKDKDAYYIRFAVHPYNQQIYQILKSSKDFSRGDVCPDCGNYSDTKPITTEEFKNVREIMRGMTK